MKYLDATNGGAEVDLDANDARTKWLVAEGYLVKPSEKDEERGVYQTSEPAKGDPTLAENRERPVPVDKLKPHVANDAEPAAAETVHGKNMGLEAEPVGNVDQAPKVKVTTHKDAGKAS